MSRTEKIQLIEAIIIIGFIVAVIYHYQVLLHTGIIFPWSTFLWTPHFQFGDFYFEVNWSKNPYHMGKDDCFYPPFIEALVNRLFRPVGSMSYSEPLLLFTATNVAGFIALTSHYLAGSSWYETLRRCVTFSFATYPFLFELERGNFEMWSVFLTVGFIYFITRNKWAVANAIMAVAVNIKPFAIFLLPIYLARRASRQLVFVGITASLLLLAGAAYYTPNVMQTLRAYRCTTGPCFDRSVVHDASMYTGSSIYTPLKLLIAFNSHPYTIGSVHNFIHWYIPFAMLVAVALVVYVALIERELWRQLLVCSVCMDLLPPVSYDYRLLHLYLPMWLFINRKGASRLDVVYCVLFGLLLIPKGYLHFQPADITEGVIVDPLILVGLTILAVTQGLRTWRRRQRTEALPPEMQEGQPRNA